MANGFNRLERFFAKRKASTTSSEPPAPASPAAEPTEQQFPSPSFIRPKGNRMAARQEVRTNQSPTRSPSVPDLLTAHRKKSTSVHTRNSSSTSSSPRQKLSPARSTSFLSQKYESFGEALRKFQFPEPPSHCGDTSPLSLTFSTRSGPDSEHRASPRCRSTLDLSISPSRLDTPPSSDPGDDEPSPRSYLTKRLPAIPPPLRAPPTPEDSPDFGPVPDSKLRLSKSVDILNKNLYEAIHLQLGEPFEQSLLQKDQTDLSLVPSARFSHCSQNLREPHLGDFLEMRDDEIAESPPSSPILTPKKEIQPSVPTMPLAVPALTPWAPSLLTLTPPVASGAATAAAFEAARIAKRYDFDLVYVVNLWPTHDGPSNSFGHSQQPMTGRLLAAHGLHHVPSPLQISSAVHCKVLRSEGWVEYRNQAAQGRDLARGYACAFYPGEYSGNGSANLNAPVSGVRLSERIDRGIVFAAYRRPRPGRNRLGTALEKEDLGQLHNDAETLVEMMIDIHVTNQLRQHCPQDQLSDNLGPIPPNTTGVVRASI